MVPRVSLTKIRRLTINRHFGKQDETKEDDLRDPGARGVAAPVRSMRCGGCGRVGGVNEPRLQVSCADQQLLPPFSGSIS